MRSSSLRLVFRMLLLAMLCVGVASHAMAQTTGPGGGDGNGNGGGSTGPGSSGPGASGPGAGGGGAGTHTFTSVLGDPDPVSAVEGASQEVDVAIGSCETKARRCIANALDAYATALRAIAPRLPPAFREMPIIVERAATKVRTARTKKEAMEAVATAIAEIHKSIALLKADDPVALKAETRASSFVIQTLQVADDKLQKAVGL
jgi:hypothetical protein